MQTEKLQAVFDKANELGGETVIIPRGTWISGTLDIGRASIYLEKGAVLKASPNYSDYRDNEFVHNEMRKTVSFLYSMHSDGVKISGEGTIDLSGSSFYDMKKPALPDCDFEFSPCQKEECPRTIIQRPTQPIFFYDCHDITLSGIKIKDAPCWTMSFHKCADILIENLLIKNDMTIPNNDGMHFCGSKNVIIKGCNITSGDDCIALSAITDWNEPCENFTISDCVLRSVSKAVVFGYIHSIIRNVTISNCIIYDSQRGLCIMSSEGTGLVEHILVSNLRIETHVRAGGWWGNGEALEILAAEHNYEGYLNPAPNRKISVNVKDIQFKNISCTSENVVAIVGGKNQNVEDIIFDGIYFEKKSGANLGIKGERTIDVSPAHEKVSLPSDGDYWLYARNCKNLKILNETVKPFEGKTLLAFYDGIKD